MQNRNSKVENGTSASLVQNGVLAEAKFRPILFSTEMVQAILEGRKTMTRRKIKNKDQPYLINEKSFINYSDSFGWNVKLKIQDNPERFEITQTFKCPYGKVNDILWVRETCQYTDSSLNFQPGYVYKAADPDWQTMEGWKWKPSIFMPKAACRIFLKITDIKVERLQDIDSGDCIAEGYDIMISRDIGSIPWFRKLWTRINGDESWESNPYVWAISFELTDCPSGFR